VTKNGVCMRANISFVTVVVAVSTALSACGGGGGSDTDSGVCSTLKIAGGAECPDAPNEIVVVRTSQGYCSGTFITPNKILTAAHCFADGGTSARVLNQYFSYGSSRVQVHPSFNPNVISDQNDVAIITIAQNAPVNPVPITTSRSTAAGDTVVTYGFGLDQSNDTYIGRIESGEAPLKATTLDVTAVSDFSVQSLSDGSGDTCQGDSGGSLLLDGNDGQPGVVAIVRAGPPACQPEGGPSDNTNLQAESVLSFVRSAAPGVNFN
jgi:secreted trypsin-like serine protease